MKALTALLLLLAPAILAAEDAPRTPQLLLSAQRIRRLNRDRERKTPRWLNFENRVINVPDSPERGFELALYYTITGDEARGREAVQWALAHNSPRQSALVLDWCAKLISGDTKTKLSAPPPAESGPFTFRRARDLWFSSAAGVDREALRPRIDWLIDGGYRNGAELYALCELIYAVRASTRDDLRDLDAHFFATLPAVLLLSAKPRELNSPDWQLHAATLALVAIDPNLPGSQFLQSWALEDNQTLREGPGVAYELLWADPYLPGVGYQNMDTWVYDEHARLFARSSWEPDSCWIEISQHGLEQENCPPNWQDRAVSFGRLLLLPMKERCIEIPHAASNESVMLWKLTPGQKMTRGKGKEQRLAAADAAGLWRPGAAVEGKVCAAAH